MSLRTDISTASSALRNSEWKAATVLEGSVIEALRFWELKQHPQGEVRELAIRKDDLDKWHLPQYIEAAGKLECVGKDTITGAQMAKDYRNLIHPGASKRAGQVCDLRSAHHAVAALDHVVRDLTKQICPRHRGTRPRSGVACSIRDPPRLAAAFVSTTGKSKAEIVHDMADAMRRAGLLKRE